MTFPQLLKAWSIIALAMIANGIIRETVLRHLVGPRVAEVLSLALGVAIILTMSRFRLRPLAGQTTRNLILASATLVVLTVAFEFLFGHYVDDKSWSQLLLNYAIWRGELWPLGLLSVALAPFIWGRWAAGDPHAA
jgi:hypothetical protein